LVEKVSLSLHNVNYYYRLIALSYREQSPLAIKLIEETCDRQNIARHQLTIHSDRGSSMTSQPVVFPLN